MTKRFVAQPVRRYSPVLCLAITFLLGEMGCAHTTPSPTSHNCLPEEEKAGLHSVAVPPGSYTPPPTFVMPAKGWRAGAKRGAQVGAVAGSGMLLWPVFPPAIVLVVLAIPSAIVGAIYGAVAAESAATVDEAELALRTAEAGLQLQEMMSARIAWAAEHQAGQHISVLTNKGDDGADMILETNFQGVELFGGKTVNPSLMFVMSAEVQLVRRHDRTVLCIGLFEYGGRSLTFRDWGINSAQAFREEVERAVQSLADKIVCRVWRCRTLEAVTQEPWLPDGSEVK